MNHAHPRLRGLAALALVAAMLVAPPALLIALGAQPWSLSPSELRLLLFSPDDGTLALAIISVVAWAAWAFATICLLSEAAAAVRGVPVPRLPVFGPGQRLAGHLVAAVALLFAASQPATGTMPAPPNGNVVMASQSVSPTAPVAAVEVPVVAAEPSASPTADAAATPTSPYTVRANDSLWKIAENELGSGSRYVEIVDLNRGLFPNGASFLSPGTVLQLPTTTTQDADDERYVVEAGDTLWDIADETLDDPTRYDEIFDASRTAIQPDGRHLDDPDLIIPGWELTIPSHDATDDTEAPAPTPPPENDEPPQPTPTPETPAIPDDPPADTVDDAADDHTAEDSEHAWLLSGLTGAGALLAGALFLVLRGHRRTQLRYRRPGQVIEPPPVELIPTEKTARHIGTHSAPQLENLDRVLRHLAEGLELTGQPMPPVDVVELGADIVTLHLVSPSEPPLGWDGDDRHWRRALDDSVPVADHIAPLPLLCSIGRDDAGHLILVNLDQIGCVSLSGDREAADALARSIAAELALSPWSVLAEVDTIGIGDELAELDPLRLHHHHADDTDFLDRVIRDLHRNGANEPETYRAIVSAATTSAETTRDFAAHVDQP